jgi:hypothetical protein
MHHTSISEKSCSSCPSPPAAVRSLQAEQASEAAAAAAAAAAAPPAKGGAKAPAAAAKPTAAGKAAEAAAAAAAAAAAEAAEQQAAADEAAVEAAVRPVEPSAPRQLNGRAHLSMVGVAEAGVRQALAGLQAAVVTDVHAFNAATLAAAQVWATATEDAATALLDGQLRGHR